jgi:hypothetical protein
LMAKCRCDTLDECGKGSRGRRIFRAPTHRTAR